MLGDRDVVLIAPAGLDLTDYFALLGRRPAYRFDPRFFRSRDSYNSLIVHEPLYRQLWRWEYHLIHQTDAFVIEDQLDEWVAKGYDYVGAPFWAGDGTMKHLGMTSVGNGGFSLRRTEPMLRALVDAHRLRNRTFARIPRTPAKRLNDVRAGRLTEERYWSAHTLKRVAPIEEGMKFAFEMGLEYLRDFYEAVTPFGCHHDWNIDYVDLHRRGERRGDELEYEDVIYRLMLRTGNL